MIHGGELLPDGRPRFRIVLILVARQNGKTELLVVLTVFWQFVECWPLILGTSTKLDYAKESWTKARKLAQRARALDALHEPGRNWYRQTNGEQESWTREIVDPDTGEIISPESRYKIAASNDEGGRSLTIDRLVWDELRQHHSYDAHNASEPAASPRAAQIWGLSNAGDDNSIVLNEYRDAALQFIETGEGDPRLGIFEWSAPEDASPTDIYALAQANPNLNRRNKDGETLLAAGRRAVAAGGEQLAGFKTESMCIHVKQLASAVDMAAFDRCLVPGDLSTLQGARIAMCLDLSPDLKHATLAAAAVLPDGRVRGAVVADWADVVQDDGSVVTCMSQLRKRLPALVGEHRPYTLGWLPNGPAAAVTTDLAKRSAQMIDGERQPAWPPRGVRVQEIRGETAAVCMGFAALVESGGFVHNGDKLMVAHFGAAQKLQRGDTWVFSRRGGGRGADSSPRPIDATYAVAGAVHIARTLPPPPPMTGPRRLHSAS